VLPDGDGVEVRRRLREWSTMAVILLSSVVVRAGLERAHPHLLIAHVTLSRVMMPWDSIGNVTTRSETRRTRQRASWSPLAFAADIRQALLERRVGTIWWG
jgi:hypothetical protein